MQGVECFSSPESKTQVSFSDHNLSTAVVIVIVNFYILSTYSKSQGQFQPNLAQNILGEGNSSLFK